MTEQDTLKAKIERLLCVNELYRGIAVFMDGQQAGIEGSLQQCANWAENVIRNHEAGVTIHIDRVDVA